MGNMALPVWRMEAFTVSITLNSVVRRYGRQPAGQLQGAPPPRASVRTSQSLGHPLPVTIAMFSSPQPSNSLRPRLPRTKNMSVDITLMPLGSGLAGNTTPVHCFRVCEPLPLRKTSVPSSQADWDAAKHLIEGYYLRSNLRLKDVIEVMHALYGFRATWVQMCLQPSGKELTTAQPPNVQGPV